MKHLDILGFKTNFIINYFSLYLISVLGLSLLLISCTKDEYIQKSQASTPVISAMETKSVVTNTDQVTFSGTCSVSSVIYVSGTDTDQTSCILGNWSYTTHKQTTDGARTYLIKQKNGSAEAEVAMHWTRDTEPPALRLLVSSLQSVKDVETFQGECEIGLSIKIKKSGNLIKELVCDSTGKFTFLIEETEDGHYEYEFSQQDEAGNPTAIIGTWVKDSAGVPGVSIEATELKIENNLDEADFQGICSRGYDLSIIEEIDQDGGGCSEDASVSDGTDPIGDPTSTTPTPTPSSNGTRIIQVSACDVGTWKFPATVCPEKRDVKVQTRIFKAEQVIDGQPTSDLMLTWIRDIEAPVVTVEGDTNVESGATHVIWTGKCETGLIINGVIQIDSSTANPSTENKNLNCDSNGRWQYDYAPTVGNDFQFTFTQTDRAGNVSTPATAHWLKDSTLPPLGLESLPTIVNNLDQADFSLSCLANVDLNFSIVSIEPSTAALESPTSFANMVCLSTGHFSLRLTSVLDGKYVIHVAQTFNGRTADANLTWVRDKVKPQLAFTSADTFLDSYDYVNFTGTCDELGGNISVAIQIASTVVGNGTTQCLQEGTWKFIDFSQSVSSEKRDYSFTSKDEAGNSQSIIGSWTHDPSLILKIDDDKRLTMSKDNYVDISGTCVPNVPVNVAINYPTGVSALPSPLPGSLTEPVFTCPADGHFVSQDEEILHISTSDDGILIFELTQTDPRGRTVKDSAVWTRDTTAPSIISFEITGKTVPTNGDPIVINSLFVPYTLIASDGTSAIDAYCVLYTTTADIPTSPTLDTNNHELSDPCWQYPSDSAASLNVSNHMMIGLSNDTFHLWVFVHDAAGNISINHNSTGTDHLKIEYVAAAPPTFDKVLVTSNAVKSTKDIFASYLDYDDLSFLGTSSELDVFWRLTDKKAQETNGGSDLTNMVVKVYYKLVGNDNWIKFDDEPSANSVSCLSGDTFTSIYTADDTYSVYGCVKITPTAGQKSALASGPFQIKIATTYSGTGLSSAAISEILNGVGTQAGSQFRILSGNTYTGTGTSLNAGVFLNDWAGEDLRNPDTGSFVIDSVSGKAYFRDVKRGILTFDDDGLIQVLIPTVAGSWVDKEKVPSDNSPHQYVTDSDARVRLPLKISIDRNGYLWIFDYNLIRRINLRAEPKTIQTIAGDYTGLSTSTTTTDPSEFAISPMATSYDETSGRVVTFIVSPDGKTIIFQAGKSTNGIYGSLPSQIKYAALSQNDNGTYAVHSILFDDSGTASGYGFYLDSAQRISKCYINHLGVSFTSDTPQQIEHIQLSVSRDVNLSGCNPPSGYTPAFSKDWGYADLNLLQESGASAYRLQAATTAKHPIPFNQNYAGTSDMYKKVLDAKSVYSAFPINSMDGNLYMLSRELGYVKKYVLPDSTNPNGQWVTIAGSGVPGICGEDTLATSCRITPLDAFVTETGNLFIVEPGRVRTLTQRGFLKTILGQAVDVGENGSHPLDARYGWLTDIDRDSDGNIFAIDLLSGKIKEILESPSFIINRIAGNGSIETTNIVYNTEKDASKLGIPSPKTYQGQNLVVGPDHDIYIANDTVVYKLAPVSGQTYWGWTRALGWGTTLYTSASSGTTGTTMDLLGANVLGYYDQQLYVGLNRSDLSVSSTSNYPMIADFDLSDSGKFYRVAGILGVTPSNFCSDETNVLSCEVPISNSNGWEMARPQYIANAAGICDAANGCLLMMKNPGNRIESLQIGAKKKTFISDLTMNASSFVWSATTTKIYFCSTDDGAIYQINKDGSGLLKIWEVDGYMCKTRTLLYKEQGGVNYLTFPFEHDGLYGIGELKF